MIRKRAVLDTENPPGSVMYFGTLQRCIDEWKKYEASRNNTEYQCPHCGTVYFEEQECDWCPGITAKRKD